MATTMPFRSRLKPSPAIPVTLTISVTILWCTSFVNAVPKGTQDFVNSSMPTIRPIFVVNFGMASVICQSTYNESDIRIHDMSILCDGKKDCFDNPAMNDESFPYCDINECADKPCHWMAHCTNTFGSYSCSCFPGFAGDGVNCADIDECELGKAACPENSRCVNLPGSYLCNCTEGYMPKGSPVEKCVDIDECEAGLYECAEGTMCQNTLGSYLCTYNCDHGYETVNGKCVDINECSKHGVCDKRATCVNTPGSYKCECDEGFTGDGQICTPLMSCLESDEICDRHASCVFGQCHCKTGYYGDGMNCFDVDECKADRPPCRGSKEPQCVNTDGGYICCDESLSPAACIKKKGAYCSGGCGHGAVCFNATCNCLHGLRGDPMVRCTDINECEEDAICPGVGQRCVNTYGSYTCCPADSADGECAGLTLVSDSELSQSQAASGHSEAAARRLLTQQGGFQRNETGGRLAIVRHGHADISKASGNLRGLITCEVGGTGCPPFSHCSEGVCKCHAGYDWNDHTRLCEGQLLQLPKETPSSKPALGSSNATSDSSLLTALPPACSKTDHTACHVLATCDENAQRCVCRNGFDGDGYTSCTKISIDCIDDSGICDTNAFCDKNIETMQL
ncbi:CRE-FBN-1 protein [Aphelenchoides avenae]|nr:CRE-FBN-1 protein [Aphelenchus avenae]